MEGEGEGQDFGFRNCATEQGKGEWVLVNNAGTPALPPCQSHKMGQNLSFYDVCMSSLLLVLNILASRLLIKIMDRMTMTNIR